MFAVHILPERLAELRQTYTPGTVVELVRMCDPYREMKPGLKGTVEYVDDAGGIHIAWENGSGLAALPGIDEVNIISRATTPSQKE